jgi:hypothetical protein
MASVSIGLVASESVMKMPIGGIFPLDNVRQITHHTHVDILPTLDGYDCLEQHTLPVEAVAR